MGLFDQSQGHRHDVPHLRHCRRSDRRFALDGYPYRAHVSGHADFWQPRRFQYVCERPWPHHDFFHDHACHDRRVWQLDGALDDRRTGHGLPTHEQHLILAATRLLYSARHCPFPSRTSRRPWHRRRLDHLCAAFHQGHARSCHGLRHPVAPPRGNILDPRRDQLHHHDLKYARPRHDAAQNAALSLVDLW